MIHLLRSCATQEQLTEMLEELSDYVKLAVDIERCIVAGVGELHADCEAALLVNGGRQEDIWGADWVPSRQEVRYQSFINIRPKQNNPSMEILDPAIRDRVGGGRRRALSSSRTDRIAETIGALAIGMGGDLE